MEGEGGVWRVVGRIKEVGGMRLENKYRSCLI